MQVYYEQYPIVATITKKFFFIDLEMSMDLITSNTHTYMKEYASDHEYWWLNSRKWIVADLTMI